MENSPTLLALASLTTATDDPNFALGEILAIIGRSLRAESGTIALLDPDSGKLEVENQFGVAQSEGDLTFALGQGLPGWVAWHAKPALLTDTSADPRYRAVRPAVRCQMAAPMMSASDQVLGVITLERDAVGAYSAADLAKLARLTDQAGRVMQRLWQLGRLQERPASSRPC